MLERGICARSLAKNLDLHESTISKWKKVKDGQAVESDQEGARPEPFSFIKNCSSGQDNAVRDALIELDLQEPKKTALKDDIIEENHTSLFYLGFLTLIFVLVESVLLHQGYSFQERVNLQGGALGFLRTFLIEIVPISMTIILKKTAKSAVDKIFIYLILFISFVYSVYSVSGISINQVLDQLHHEKVIDASYDRLKKEQGEKQKGVDYFKKRRQSNGTIGWPNSVLKLEKQIVVINSKIYEIEQKRQEKKSLMATMSNGIFDLLYKIIFQLASLVLISQITIGFEKMSKNSFSKNSLVLGEEA